MAESSPLIDRRNLGLAALVVLAGLFIFGWTIFSAISEIGDGLTRIEAPGTSELNLQEVGDYTIYYENRSFLDGRFYSAGEGVPPGLVIEVVDLTSGEGVDLRPPAGEVTYDFAGRSGRSIATFEVQRPGTFRIDSGYPAGSEGPKAVLAIGTDFFRGALYKIGLGLAALFGSIAAGAAILISAARRREREEKRLREENRLIRSR
ncbi:hypothetical protein [Methanothrix harundinacea]|uniref:Uncharacterized protein n=1 Tax=Methanothrix harundinacea (strain 6Ac) TaxID=1110509 RepID=G7WK65_METH6|nr:hypothetical protein [Methanothrix harundinacea]AET64058.1 hypothetical protein Mhar_0680 [Methanothrix harundinacea 6Ac]